MDFPQGPLPSPMSGATPTPNPMPNGLSNGAPGGFPSAAPAGPMPGAPMGDYSMPQSVNIPVQNSNSPLPAMPTSMTPEDQVYTMPDKFIPSTPNPASGRPKRSKKGVTIALIVIIIVAVLAIIGGIVFYVLNVANSTPTTTTTQNNVVVNRNANSNINSNANANSNLNGNVNVDVTNANGNVNAVVANTNAVTNTNTEVVNTNTVANTNTVNTNTVVNSNTNTTVTAVPSKDTDQDQLTNEEEKVWVTKADLPDSDGDGYTDGAEVLAGYDPANNLSSMRLQNSPNVGIYDNTTFNYTVIYPKAWIADALDKGNQTDVTITPNTLDIAGQFISITVQDNPAGLTALDYYVAAAKVPEASVVAVKSFSGLEGVWSADQQTAYYTDTEHVYVVSYRSGTSPELYFPTTFQLIVKSFALGN